VIDGIPKPVACCSVILNYGEVNPAVSTHDALRAARQSSGLTLRQLAARIGVSSATLSAIENGKTGISVQRLHVLAGALNVAPADLIGEADTVAHIVNRESMERPASGAARSWRYFEPLSVDAVMAAAIPLFVEIGYHGTTMRMLAARSGVSVPAIYHRYLDKQDILVQILTATMTELRWRVDAARAQGPTSVDRLALMVEALALFHTYRRELAFIGASEMRSLNVHNSVGIVDSRDQIQHLLDAEIGSAINDLDLTVEHPRDVSRAVTTMCTSLPQWFRIGGSRTPEDIAAEYARFALALLGLTAGR
jgi:AcrR family transcriptional regulator/DNA-binding XRE family transcriptional regulator